MRHLVTLLVMGFVATIAYAGANEPALQPLVSPVVLAADVVTNAPAPPIPALELEPDPDESDAYIEQLESYTSWVMGGWTPAVHQVPTADEDGIARDIAKAVAHESEDPGHCPAVTGTDGRKRCLWGVPGWNSDHAKAVLLAAVAYWEGARYAASVDNGDCNDPVWRADPANKDLIHIMGNCDGGRAHSLWQIWPRGEGEDESPISKSCDKDAVAVRYTACRCALQILRMSMMATGSLVGYTGESAWGDRTKANLRQEFARKALKKHPWR